MINSTTLPVGNLSVRLLYVDAGTVSFSGGKIFVDEPFYIGARPLTAGHWIEILGAIPSGKCSATEPLVGINWFEAIAFSSELGRQTGNLDLSLPTLGQFLLAIRQRGVDSSPQTDSFQLNVEFEWCLDKAGDIPHQHVVENVVPRGTKGTAWVVKSNSTEPTYRPLHDRSTDISFRLCLPASRRMAAIVQ